MNSGLFMRATVTGNLSEERLIKKTVPAELLCEIIREFQRRRGEKERKRKCCLSASAMKSLPAQPPSIQAPGGLSAPHKTHSAPVMGCGTRFCSVCRAVT